MLTFLLANVVNALLFVSFLGVSMAFGNGDETTTKPETDLNANTIISDDGANTVSVGENVNLAYFPGAGGGALKVTTGNNLAEGASSDDRLSIGGGDNLAFGGGGYDFLTDSTGTDDLYADTVYDSPQEGTGDDILDGSDGTDILFDDEDRNELDIGAGVDYLFGGAGDDLLNGIFAGDDLDDTVYSEPEENTLIPGSNDESCEDKGFDIIVIRQSELDGDPAYIRDLNDDDSLRIDYTPKLDEDGGALVPEVSVVNYEDGTGAFIQLDGITVAEVLGGQNMDPASINLVAV